MTIQEVKQAFVNKENAACPITEKLVKAGYQQKGGGYIKRAKQEGLEIDYKKNLPSQYWHLMTYCNSQDDRKTFGRSIVCGELIFWMAEVLGCVSHKDMNSLADTIIKNAEKGYDGEITYNRKLWNNKIQELCFDKIEKAISVHPKAG